MSKMSSKKNVSQSSIFNFFHPVTQSTSSNEKEKIKTINEKRTHKEISDNSEKKEINPNKKSFPPKSKMDKESEKVMKKMEKNMDTLLNEDQNVKKSKKKLIKSKNKKKVILDSESEKENDSDYKMDEEKRESEDEEEIYTPIKKNKKKKIEKMSEEEDENDNESLNKIDLNNFLKETLDEKMEKDPTILEINIQKTYNGNGIRTLRNFENETPSNKNKDRNESRSRSRSNSKDKAKNKRKSNKKKKDDMDEELNNLCEDENNESVNSKDEGLARNDLHLNPHDALPDFLKPENIKDLKGNRPDSPEYDYSTLYVPSSFLKNQTPAMRQFWDFKSHNFDKVLFFKLGKFYEMFFDDAIIGNQILDLNWVGNDPKKLHVGFPEKLLEYKAEKLVSAGFKIAVIEQMETVEQFKNRIKSEKVKSDKVIKRELCNVLTKGTYYKYNNENNSKYDNNENDQKNKIYNYNKNKFCCALFCKAKERKSKEEEFLEDNMDGIPRNEYDMFI